MISGCFVLHVWQAAQPHAHSLYSMPASAQLQPCFEPDTQHTWQRGLPPGWGPARQPCYVPAEHASVCAVPPLTPAAAGQPQHGVQLLQPCWQPGRPAAGAGCPAENAAGAEPVCGSPAAAVPAQPAGALADCASAPALQPAGKGACAFGVDFSECSIQSLELTIQSLELTWVNASSM